MMYKHTVKTPGKTLRLLLPEWQGYGVSNVPARGARALGAALFNSGGADVVEPVESIDAPDTEALATSGGVLGLDSIALRAARARNLLRARQPDRIVMVGATCGVEVAPVSYLNEKYSGEIAVLWLDAHADLNTPESSPSGHFHGMVLRTLLGDGPAALVDRLARPLTPAQVCLVGARDLDPPEAEFARATGIRLAGLEAFTDPVEFARSIRRAGFERVYLHLDLDVTNPDDFASSLMRTAGGPSLDDVMALVCQVREQCDVVGFSVVEFCDRAGGDLERLRDALAPHFPGV
ncbi:MAG TPA: arginase family protein [Vicinamibacterales bacterium]|nr:arginase family protein [Vicinamibacterales bacterium]